MSEQELEPVSDLTELDFENALEYWRSANMRDDCPDDFSIIWAIARTLKGRTLC